MPVPSPAFARPVTLRRTLACDLAGVRPAVQTVRGFLVEQGWAEGDLMSFDLALAEACNNAIEYAIGPGRDQPITVEVLSDASQVEFRIHDHTPGFDWPAKIELPSPESESGRGLWLMASLMNYAGYFRGRGENILVLRKSRPSVAPILKPRPEPEPAADATEKDAIISDMVEELSSCYESLSAIFRYSGELGQTGSLKEFARRLLGDLLRILQADWFVLRLVPKDKLELAVFAASEASLELEPLTPTARAEGIRQPLEIEAALTRQTVWFDAAKPPAADDPLANAKAGSAGMAHPIMLGGRLIGTLTLGRKQTVGAEAVSARSGATFTAAQTNVVTTFADFLAIQIANARFQEEQLHQRLVAHELEIARNIQRSLLPSTLPQVAGFSLAAFCRSAREVGGDFYDAIKIGDDALLLVIADVMGKGIPAAMFAAILRSLLRASPELTRQPSALLTRVNRLMFRELSDVDMFITAQLALVDGAARRITTASAGHCPLGLALTGAGAGTVRSFSPEGMPLGIKPDTVFEDETAELPENCRVLLYSDGLTETLDRQGKPFGQARLFDWLMRSTAGWRTAEKLKDELVSELDAHHADAVLRDDQTFLILCG
jgi:serine phosphatase RsbU (regulator of sigma subunit)/anti-sigma regulatory factor (Ser/Thr protein kinase)